MTERTYVAKKRAVAQMLAVVTIIWIQIFGVLYLLAERRYSPTVSSIFSTSFVALCALVGFIYTSREMYRMLYTPQIIIADTVLILGYGKTILNWEDIDRINISKNTFTIFKRARIFRIRWEFIGNIANKADLVKDLERQCMERNIIITKETSWLL